MSHTTLGSADHADKTFTQDPHTLGHAPSPFTTFASIPEATGLYSPENEKDACGLAMIATLRGTPGHDIVDHALTALRRLEHRGAVGADEGTGDGAGILLQIPDAFLREVVDFDLPELGKYAVGTAYLPTGGENAEELKEGLTQIAQREGLRVLGWREVPVKADIVGKAAREVMPYFVQMFIAEASGEDLDAVNAPFTGHIPVINQGSFFLHIG